MPPCFEKWCNRFDDVFTYKVQKLEVSENAIRGYLKNSFSWIDCQVAIKLCSYFQVDIGEMFQIK
ncbi:hypothetical protein PI95_021910 [Hassallia byssoidea VB512170]|uniref:Uncharacterized protein n=1 Tax=Hassallia byssoidea VB512170 TaxID=1304833 RepID=A0A846HEV0_9CYAN|nr:hypothetical protein [Hassalia byssoidea VB512170]